MRYRSVCVTGNARLRDYITLPTIGIRSAYEHVPEPLPKSEGESVLRFLAFWLLIPL